MTCAECREAFSAYADDALSADARGVVETHLAGCADCRREWQRFFATVDLLHIVEPERAPAGFVDRVVAAARPLPWYRRLARGLLVPWTVKLPVEAAAIVMVAGLAVLIFQRSPELQRAAAPAEMASESGTLMAKTAPDASKDVAQAPEVRAQELIAPTLADSRNLEGAKPDAGRSEVQAPPIAQQQAQEPVAARRQQYSEQAAPPPPAAAPPPATAKSAPAATRPAATAESPEPRAKRTDKLAQEAERDAGAGFLSAREGKTEDARSQVQRLTVRAAPAAVELSLAVTDRTAAEREIATAVERLGGAMVTPAPGTLEIMVPNRAFAALTGDLTRIGTLRIERQPAELPDSVRITLRLTD